MERRLVQAFVSVADSESVSGAAKVLNYSQPRVSQHLQMFEASVGCQVFDRSRRGMQLTENGVRILPLARIVLYALDLMSTMVSQGNDRSRA
ncbi:MAG: LysR family transcriptional regulator [Dermatophilaceae bacterium]